MSSGLTSEHTISSENSGGANQQYFHLKPKSPVLPNKKRSTNVGMVGIALGSTGNHKKVVSSHISASDMNGSLSQDSRKAKNEERSLSD